MHFPRRPPVDNRCWRRRPRRRSTFDSSWVDERRIHGSTLRARPLEEKAVAARLVERHVLPLVISGRVRVPVEAVFGLEDVEAAYARFAAGGKLGKIVLDVSA